MTLADLLNVGTGFAYKGQTYTFRQPTLLEQALFQRWLEGRARAAVERSDLSDAQKEAQQNLVNRDCAKGVYEWGAREAVEALWSPAGLAKVVAIVCADQGVDDELAEAIVAENIRGIAAVLVSKVQTDPKVTAQVLASLGLPSDFLSSSSRTRRSGTGSTTSRASPTTSSSPSSASSGTRKRGRKSRRRK